MDIQKIRKKYGLSLRAFGPAIGIKKSYASDLEKGRKPLSKKLKKRIEALDDRCEMLDLIAEQQARIDEWKDGAMSHFEAAEKARPAIGHGKGDFLPEGHPAAERISKVGEEWLAQFKARAEEDWWIELDDLVSGLQCRKIEGLYYFGIVSPGSGQVLSLSGKFFAPANSAGFQYVCDGFPFYRACAWVRKEAQRLEWIEMMEEDERAQYGD